MSRHARLPFYIAGMRGLRLLIVYLLAGCHPPASTPAIDGVPMLVIAHRGASAYAPEHTFAAWDLALEMGADFLEQDLQLTRDGVLIVMHDDSLDRTTGGRCRGRVIDHTLDQIRDCDVGSWFNTRHPELARDSHADERIRTLDEVFARYAGRANFYIETKNPDEAPGMEEALLAQLDRHDLRVPAAREWRVIIQSFSEKSLRRMHQLDPSLPLIQLLHARRESPRTIQGRLRRIAEYAVGIGPSWRDVDTELARAVRGACLELHPYTVNDPELMHSMTQLGATGMFTDEPDVLLRQRPADEPRGLAAAPHAFERYRNCHSGR